MLYRRDQGPEGQGDACRAASSSPSVAAILGEMQDGLFARARAFRDENTKVIDTRADVRRLLHAEERRRPEIHGGFALVALVRLAPSARPKIKDALKVTIRCIPTGGFEGAPWAAALTEKGPCVVCGKPGKRRVVFAKSY